MSQFSRTRRLLSFLLPAMLVLSLVLSAPAAQFSIATNAIKNPFPRAAFDGTNYLVGLQIVRGDGTTEPRAQLVSSSSALLGSQITTGQTGDPPKVGFGGANYLLAWADYSNSAGGNVPVFGQLISTAGAVIGSPFQISQSATVEELDAISFGGTNFLVTWSDKRRGGTGAGDRDIYGRFVSVLGALQGVDFKISGAAGKDSETAFDGANFLVVWRDDVLDTDIYGRFLSPAGTFIAAEFVIDANALPSDNPINVLFDGTKYLVAFSDEIGGQGTGEWDVFGRFVTPAGTVLTNRIAITTAPGSQIFPTLAFDGANYLVAWLDGFGSTNTSTKARFLDATGTAMSSEFLLSGQQGAKVSLVASLVFDGRRYFGVVGLGEVLTNGTGGFVGFTNGAVNGTFISPLPRGAFPIGITSSNEFGGGAAFDGTNFLVGIGGGPVGAADQITAQLFSPVGTLIGSRISIGRFGSSPKIAFDGTNYFMVWEDVSNSTHHIYGQFISRSGALVASPFAISPASGNQFFDSINHIVFDGGNYFIVWRDGLKTDINIHVYGQLVSPAGTLLGGVIPISTDPQSQLAASVGFDGANFFVAYQNRRSGSTELYDTYGNFVSRAGVPASPFLISQAPTPSFNPTSLAFDGSNYLVVWNRDIGPGFPSPTDWDIYARLVTRAGSFVGNEFPITTAPGSQPYAFVTFDGANYLVSWFDQATGVSRSRFFNRAGVPVTSEFALFGSQGTRSPLTSLLFDGSRLVALTSYLDSNFANGDVYGLILPQTRLDFAAPVANGQVPLRFTGMPGVTYAVQGTTNLLSTGTVWTSLASSNALSGTFNYTDTNAASFNRRFYRAVLP